MRAHRVIIHGRQGPVMLVTADGSVDCQSDPGEQELLVRDLHHCEALCALAALAPGGALVLKMFTLYENPTVALLYLLGCHFAELHVCKPAASKGGNAETYVVGKGQCVHVRSLCC